MTTADFRIAEALGHDRSDKRLDILRRIEAAGSISEAARGAGISYKAAWQALETLANLAGTDLVEKAVGGTGGGGARLTAAGRRLLDLADRLEQARAAVLADARHDTAAAALALRTSLRNQFPCRVREVRTAGALVRVELALADDTRIGSRITRESAELLGLEPGLAVLALCKATAVTIAGTLASRPGHNRLAGTVARLSPGAAGVAEISVALRAGPRLVGFAAVGHGLAVGSPALALVEETAIVIAIGG